MNEVRFWKARAPDAILQRVLGSWETLTAEDTGLEGCRGRATISALERAEWQWTGRHCDRCGEYAEHLRPQPVRHINTRRAV
jgi:hypothetical protein